jgi:hypothetical protein
MVHPCPSCGTRLKLSNPAAVARAKCPRCGTSLGGPGARPEPGPDAGANRTRRAVLVGGAFALCLLLPLALLLVLLANSAGPEEAKQPEPQLAQGGPLPPPPSWPSARGQPAPEKDRDAKQTAPQAGAPKAEEEVPGGPGSGLLDRLAPALPSQPQTPADPAPKDNTEGPPPDSQPADPVPPATSPKAEDPPGLGTPPPPKTPSVPDGLGAPVPPRPPAPEPVAKGPPPPPPQADPPPKKPQPKLPASSSQRVTFLGTVATGRRFCIIADNSGSMRGTPVETLKVEVLRTLRSLAKDSQFHVIFFNSEPEPQPVPGWLNGGQAVEQVLPWLRTITARGGTRPTPAFELAFHLDPKPDAIFFMTDGVIPPNVPDAVAALNARGRLLPVHTILFSDKVGRLAALTQPPLRPLPPAQQQALARRVQSETARLQRAILPLQRIAAQSGGTFRAVPVPPNPPRAPWAR